MEKRTPTVKMRDITKRFGSVLANDKVWLDIYRGEVLALLGENGSGKTTLMNMLSGIYRPDEGEIYVDDKLVDIRSPKDAFDLGISTLSSSMYSPQRRISPSVLKRSTTLRRLPSVFVPSAISTALMSTPIRRYTTCPFRRSRRSR